MADILIVDADADLTARLQSELAEEGHTSRVMSSGQEGLAACSETPRPDLVILDPRLPDMPGTEVCRRLRAAPATARTGILMLSARDEEIDRVVGFEVGTDDFVAKPYSTRELMLRVRALLRRSAGLQALQAPAANTDKQVTFGLIKVDADAHQAWVDGDEIVLTALEFRLLLLLIDRRGRVQSRDRLLSDVWSIEPTHVTTRTVDTHVKRLRQKLGPASAYIETLRGVGYRCRARPAEAS